MQAEYRDGELHAPNCSFKVRGVLMEEGLVVEANTPIIALIADQYITAPCACRITRIHARPDQIMNSGDLIATVERFEAVAVGVSA